MDLCFYCVVVGFVLVFWVVDDVDGCVVVGCDVD